MKKLATQSILDLPVPLTLLVGTEVDGDYHHNREVRELLDRLGIVYTEQALTDQRGNPSPWLSVSNTDMVLCGESQIRAWLNQTCWNQAHRIFTGVTSEPDWYVWVGTPNRFLGGEVPHQKYLQGEAIDVLGLLVAAAEGAYM